MAEAAIASQTPVNVFMDMTITMFHEFVMAFHEIFEARKNAKK